jgi:hypothetical protein
MGVLHDTKYDQGWNREIIAGLHWLTISPTVGTSSDGKGKTWENHFRLCGGWVQTIPKAIWHM